MKIETAKNVHRDFFQDTIDEYIYDRVLELQSAFEYTQNFDEVNAIKGQLKELRLLGKAKEYAQAILEKARNGKN